MCPGGGRPGQGRRLWREDSRPLWRAGAPASSSPTHVIRCTGGASGARSNVPRCPKRFGGRPEKSFVPGVYQRQSIVVDLGTVVPRGRYLKSIFLICRRCAPPVTPARLTSFALQRTHGCETVRLRGNEGSRRAQHRTFMFAGPWDADARE